MTPHERLFARLLCTADVDTLDAIAAYYEQVAFQARQLADRRRGDRKMRQQTSDRVRRLRQLPDVVATYAQSMSLERAISAAAQATGVPEITVEAQIKISERRKAHAARADRNAAIERLMRDGHTDPEIAARVGVHVSTVRRVLKGKARVPGMPAKPLETPVTTQRAVRPAKAVREPPALAAAE